MKKIIILTFLLAIFLSSNAQTLLKIKSFNAQYVVLSTGSDNYNFEYTSFPFKNGTLVIDYKLVYCTNEKINSKGINKNKLLIF